MFDLLKFSPVKFEKRLVKMRKLTTNNDKGDSYGITIPHIISEELMGKSFFVGGSAGLIILIQSGCRL